jgi:hypothetical protein
MSFRTLRARDWRIRKSWRWNSRSAAGFRTSVRLAVASVTTSEARRTGRNSRSTLTPAALKATTSRSLASRPPARSTATSSAMGSVWARNDGSMKTRSWTTREKGTPFVMTRSVRL